MRPRRVALAAWELGAGRGHLEHLRPIVAALLKQGWTVLAAVRDLEAGRAVFGSLDPASRHRRFAVGQAPIFVHRPGPRAVLPSSLAEILAHEGFADTALLRPVIETWARLIDAVKPSVIVADFSPGAVAAAYGRIPVVMTGNGWTIPPDGSPIPPLPISPYDAAAAAFAESRICDAIAEATTGRWRPDRFAQLLRGDASFVFTSTLLDPYRASRREPVYWPPNLTIPSRARASDKATSSRRRRHPRRARPGRHRDACLLRRRAAACAVEREDFSGADRSGFHAAFGAVRAPSWRASASPAGVSPTACPRSSRRPISKRI